MGDFATTARILQQEARGLGLVVPAFRSARDGRRVLRRYPGNVVVIVPRSNDAARDCIDGIVKANDLEGDAAETVRRALTQSLGVLL